MFWYKKYTLGRERNKTLSLQDIKDAKKHETYKDNAYLFLVISADDTHAIIYKSKKKHENQERHASDWYNEKKENRKYAVLENRITGITRIYNPNLNKEFTHHNPSVDFDAIFTVIQKIQKENTEYNKKDGVLQGIYFAAIYKLLDIGELGKSENVSVRDFAMMMKLPHTGKSNIHDHSNKIQLTDGNPPLELKGKSYTKKMQFTSFVKLFLELYNLERVPKPDTKPDNN